MKIKKFKNNLQQGKKLNFNYWQLFKIMSILNIINLF